MFQSLAGQLLAASPELRDPNFARSVVLIIQHNEDGAFGLILNRPTPAPLREVWHHVSQSSCDRDDKLHMGGPVEGPLMALHQEYSCCEKSVSSEVFFCSDRDHLERLVTHEGEMKFFAGFAGWSSGQLEGELAEDSWLVWPASADHVFSSDPSLWDEVVRQVSADRMVHLLKIKHIPPDPSMN
ncbi:MAG: YqgE/AlgH family protein [Planctomycetes bacterium]|nr:YqgE/AlgH family protein [Planctomycetota bacterium]